MHFIYRGVELIEQVLHPVMKVTVALLVTTAIGCHRDAPRLALLTPSTNLWGGVLDAATLKARGCGLTVRLDGPPRADDLSKQLAIFEKVSHEHFNAVAIAPIQMQAFRNPVQRLSLAGTSVIVIGDDLGIRNRNVAYILVDQELAGKLAADEVAKLLNGVGTVAVTGLEFRQPNSVRRDQALELELSNRAPGIRVVARRAGTTNLFEEQQTADDLLSSSKPIDAIVALSAIATRGAFYAEKARNMRLPVHLIGFDQELLLPLANHEMDAVVAVPAAEIGQTIAGLVCDRLNGKELGGPYTLSPFLLTPDNIKNADVQQQLSGGDWWEGEK